MNQKMKEKEAQKRQDFISRMQGFLNAHGTDKTDVRKLIDYAVKKTGCGFNHHGVEWTVLCDGIRCHRSWESHSFFDDGGGTEGDIDWSFSYMGSEGNYIIHNDKLNDLSTYHVATYAKPVKEEFYCKNPFGLAGIYKISFCGYEVNTD